MTYGEAGHGLGEHPNRLRYAAPTGTVLIRWDGARQPTVWTVPPPDVDPRGARLELARRYLHVFGPATPAAFAHWAGIGPAEGRAAFDALVGSLTPVRTPVGDAWILTRDVPAFRAPADPQRRRGFSRVGTRTSSCKEPIGSSWSLTPTTVGRSGPPSLAWRCPRGGRDRRDVETSAGRRHDRGVAPALAHRARRGGGGGCVHAAGRHRAGRPDPPGRLRMEKPPSRRARLG